jgi:hypothetical protein
LRVHARHPGRDGKLDPGHLGGDERSSVHRTERENTAPATIVAGVAR